MMRYRCGTAAVLLILFGLLVPAATPAPAAPAAAYWVFFTDRGPHSPAPADWLAVAERLPSESWALREAGRAGAVPEVRDLPVYQPYVDQVADRGPVRHQTRWLNGVSASLSPEALELVRALPFVREVRPVARSERQSLGPAFAADGTPLGRTLVDKALARGPDPYGPSYGQLQEIGVPAVHALGYTGNRVRMMMLDSGFRKDHHAFSSTRILAEYDFVFHDGNTQNEPADDPGAQHHGTGTWATNGGYDPGHIVGPAYGAEFVLAKTEDIRAETQVEEDYYVAALEWAESLGVRVTSASLSYTCFDDGFCYDYPLKDGDTPVISQAVDIASQRGILCVNSAGNYGYLGPMSLGTPADADSVISVGAVDSLNVVAGFSSLGPSDDGRTKPEVVARGVATWWADASGVDTYGPASGTSLSCPLVSGVAALLAEAHPEWSNMQIRSALMNTADRHTAPDNIYGWGRVDALAALNSAPVLFPLPYDLVSPVPGASLVSQWPTFVWRRTVDGDSPGPVQYAVHVWQPVPGGPEWTLPAGTDTTLTTGLPFQAHVLYRWEVFAEDSFGHRRLSRESRSFSVLGSAAVEPPAEAGPARFVLQVGPNPFASEVRFAPVQADATTKGTGVAGSNWSWAIYDPQGRRVALAPQPRSWDRGDAWDGTDVAGRDVPAGVYYLEAYAGALTTRRVLVRMP